MDQEMLQAESLAWAEWPDMSWSWGRISEAAETIAAVPVPEVYGYMRVSIFQSSATWTMTSRIGIERPNLSPFFS